MNGRRASGMQLVMLTLESIVTIFIIGLGTALLVLVSASDAISYDVVTKLKYESYARQIIDNPACFAKQDAVSEHTYQRVMDRAKLTMTQLHACTLVSHEPSHHLPTRVNVYTNPPITVFTSDWLNESFATQKVAKQGFVDNGTDITKTTLTFEFDRPVYTKAAEDEAP